MAKPKSTPTDIDPDQAPAAGGSYLRHPDTGELTRVAGPALNPDAAADAPAETPAAAGAAVGATPATSQE